jgi:hypothetical protein
MFRNRANPLSKYLQKVDAALKGEYELGVDHYLTQLCSIDVLEDNTPLNAIALAFDHLEKAHRNNGPLSNSHISIRNNLMWKVISRLEAKDLPLETVDAKRLRIFFFALDSLAKNNQLGEYDLASRQHISYWDRDETTNNAVLANILLLVDLAATKAENNKLNGPTITEALQAVGTFFEKGMLNAMDAEQQEKLESSISKLFQAICDNPETTDRDIAQSLQAYTKLTASENTCIASKQLKAFFIALTKKFSQLEKTQTREVCLTAQNAHKVLTQGSFVKELDKDTKEQLKAALQTIVERYLPDLTNRANRVNVIDLSYFLSMMEPIIRCKLIDSLSTEQEGMMLALIKQVMDRSNNIPAYTEAFYALTKINLEGENHKNFIRCFSFTNLLKLILMEPANAARDGKMLWIVMTLLDQPFMQRLQDNDISMIKQLAVRVSKLETYYLKAGIPCLLSMARIMARYPQTTITAYEADALRSLFRQTVRMELTEAENALTSCVWAISELVEKGKIVSFDVNDRDVLKEFLTNKANKTTTTTVHANGILQAYAKLAKNGLIKELNQDEINDLQKLVTIIANADNAESGIKNSAANAQIMLAKYTNYTSSTSFSAYTGPYSRRERSLTPPLPQTPPLESTPPDESMLKNGM